MSGEVKITRANVAQEYAKLQNNGVLAPEVKEKQILEFKNKYATELKEAGVDLESDPAKDRNNLWGFTTTGTIPTAADEAAAEATARPPTSPYRTPPCRNRRRRRSTAYSGEVPSKNH